MAVHLFPEDLFRGVMKNFVPYSRLRGNFQGGAMRNRTQAPCVRCMPQLLCRSYVDDLPLTPGYWDGQALFP
jgi:hypothetical protein